MKLIEIFQSPSRNENVEQYAHHFPNNAPIVYTHTPTKYVMKRAVDGYGDIRYGVFNPETNQLISYAHFSKEDSGWYISSMPATSVEHQKQGWITLIFTYAVNHDHIRIMSDDQHTSEAKNMWRAFSLGGVFDVRVINTSTGEILQWTSENDPYLPHNADTHRLIAIPRTVESRHLCESWSSKRGVRADRKRLGIFDYGQYGEGTSSNDFVNW